MGKHYRWFVGSETDVTRCRDLMDQAYGCGPGEHLMYVREDFAEFPATQFGTPVGAGSDAGTNIGAAAVEACRQSVINDENQLINALERQELLVFFAQDQELETNWWYNEDGEILRAQGELMENPPQGLAARANPPAPTQPPDPEPSPTKS